MALAMGLAAPLASAQERNSYALNIDKTAYTLAFPQRNAGMSAGAGSSSPLPPVQRERQQQADLQRMADAARSEEEARVRRARDDEHRISALVQERDAWQRRAVELESELRSRGALPAHIRPAPVSR